MRKNKAIMLQKPQVYAESHNSAQDLNHTRTVDAKIPTPPTSPAADKMAASDADVDIDKQLEQSTKN